MPTYFQKYAAGQRRFWYVDGLTSDEFYPAHCIRMDLPQLLYHELHEAGYDKIIFYNARKRLYCYDDRSYALLVGKEPPETKPEQPHAQPSRSPGLKRGKWGKKAATKPELPAEPPVQEQEASDRGKASGVRMAPTGNSQLHAGVQANIAILNQFLAMMRDESHATVIVIVDANNFLRDLSRVGDWESFMNEVSQLPSSNENIMVFVFPDIESGSILNLESIKKDAEQLKQLNFIPVPRPDAMEYCNLLHHFRLLYGLKVHVSEIPEIAREIARCITKITQDEAREAGIAGGVRIKMLSGYLRAFIQKGEYLTVENAHTVFQNAGMKRMQTAQEMLSGLIGMASVKKQILEKYGYLMDADPRSWMQLCPETRIKPSQKKPDHNEFMHIVLTGNPGTGKTTVAKLLGQFFAEAGILRSGHVVETDRSGLVAGYVGQTAIKTREQVTKALGGVLFIDEAYSITQDETNSFGQECIDTLVKAMDEFKDDLIVVAAGYPEEMEKFLNANPGLMSRFCERIEIPDYSAEELTQILDMHLKSRGLRLSEPLHVRMPAFFESWQSKAGPNWGNAREAVRFCSDLHNSIQRHRDDAVTMSDNETGETYTLVEERHVPEKYRQYLVPMEEMRGRAMESILRMPGLASVKTELQKIDNALITGNIGEPGHYVFMGAPGTGKTTVARKMGELFRSYKMLKRGHLVETDANKLIAAGVEKTVKDAMDGVLFIDEAYQLTNSAQGNDAIDSLVAQMENNRSRLCVILAGYDNEMDEMLRNANPGLASRTHRIYFENYSGEELFEILKVMLPEMHLQADADFLEYSHRALVRYAERLQKQKNFGNARYLREEYLKKAKDCMNARLAARIRNGETISADERNLLTGADIPELLRKHTKQPLPEPDNRPLLERLDDLVGFAEIKKYLHQLLKVHRFQQNDPSGGMELSQQLHMILKGNPGTGKTMIAKLIGEVYKECGILPVGKTFKVGREDLVAGYVGQTAPKTQQWIDKAMGSVLFIDEAYSLTDSGNENDYGSEAIATLVAAMTDHKGEFAVIAAGYPDKMEQFVRSNAGLNGRFKVFTVEDYTPEELAKIFRCMCRDIRFAIDPALDEKLEDFFRLYKEEKSRNEDWQNARECENLRSDMQGLWMDAPVTVQDEAGNTQYCFTEAHIPEEKRCFLPDVSKR